MSDDHTSFFVVQVTCIEKMKACQARTQHLRREAVALTLHLLSPKLNCRSRLLSKRPPPVFDGGDVATACCCWLLTC